MRAVVQRVTSAKVTVGDRTTGEIGQGLLVFVGVDRADGPPDVQYIASKVRDLRIFMDEDQKMNRSVLDIKGEILVVSQFTLSGDARNGRRPSFASAALPQIARALYEDVVRELQASGLRVATGEFQAMMQVALTNDGPVTILLDSRKTF
ncbi:MAG: D-tyrosyl-tRNA(Tyr) deacylase [Acidobacteria bacterium RIFCSPLOWO2_12_FULL_67_14b]|nr:MAG: D-tyrosyl-tRNA(Tyr) deacylase [Acidobacteria bacterium RIFCSPLOWO2_12_FULL_67_14b]